jgi:diguanylate cyclase (GGDEF)-like protein
MAFSSEQKIFTVSRMGEQSLAIRLVEHLIVPTFVIGADGHVLIWNKACERLTNLSAAQVLNTADHWRAFYDEPRPCLANLVAEGRYAEIETFYSDWAGFGLTDFGVSIETSAPMPLVGRPMMLAVDAGPIYDESGSLLAVIETFRDITAQKEAQNLLETLAARDGLTDLLNRRSFDHTVAAEMRRCARDGHPLSLLMIDIDHFKRFNDCFGHLQGDQCLKRVAAALRGILRGGDVAARYGGEEFAVVLPNTDRQGAEAVAERSRRAVQDLQIAHPDSPASVVTLSIGVSTGVEPDLSPTDLVASADEALYASKRDGRNRVSFAAAQSSSIVLF